MKAGTFAAFKRLAIVFSVYVRNYPETWREDALQENPFRVLAA
jgi:hypothetical protein